MQYIKKQNVPPVEWNNWFLKATGVRSFDYGADYGSLTNIIEARKFLLKEQNGLCAYCQQPITIENSSIEHVIPKELNKELSTNYFNLVAVCKIQSADPETGKLHCDKAKGSALISPFIFASISNVTEMANNKYFIAWADGTINPKYNLKDEDRKQVEAFIHILNLNHKQLKERRAKDVLDGLINAYASISNQNHQKNIFWEITFKRILNNDSHPFRQFLLIYIGGKRGIN